MRDAAETGVPAMRPLMLDFPDDERTYGIDDQFLFGSDLLIAPVLTEAATQRGVYLPAGEWYDYWSGTHYTGGKSIDVPVTLSSIPIFVRGGAFVFAQPVVQHTGEMPAQTLIVTAFPGSASERWLYEDDGNGFDYRRGVFARRRFASRADASGTVIEIGAPNRSVSVNGVALSQVSDLDKADRGWTSKDGAVMIRFPDRFERTEVRIER